MIQVNSHGIVSYLIILLHAESINYHVIKQLTPSSGRGGSGVFVLIRTGATQSATTPLAVETVKFHRLKIAMAVSL